MSEITEIKTLNGYPLADTKARADIATLSEEIEELKNAGEEDGEYRQNVSINFFEGTTAAYMYYDSTFSGFRSNWLVENRMYLEKLKFPMQGKDETVTQIRIRIALNENTDSAVVFDKTLDVNVVPGVEQEISCAVPDLLIPANTAVFFAIDANKPCKFKFSHIDYTPALKLGYVVDGHLDKSMETIYMGAKYRLWLVGEGYTLSTTLKTELNLPGKLYALVGEELNVYFDDIIGEGRYTDYEWNVTCDIGMQMERGFVLMPNEAGSYPITISIKKDDKEMSATSLIVVSGASQGNGVTRSVIILGDSTTAHGTVVEKLNSNFESDVMNISMLGTLGEAPNKHEGRSGWTLGLYHGAGTDDVANPFYNPGTAKFDASYYFTSTGVSIPDYFIINLGINDMFGATDDASAEAAITKCLTRMDDTIASIRSAAPNTKICVALTIPPNYSQDAFGKAYGCGQTRDRYKRNNALWVSALMKAYQGKESENVYVIPINTNLDTQYNMGTETAQRNKRNAETYAQPVAGGAVHPDTAGYWQIADVYWFFLKSFEN